MHMVTPEKIREIREAMGMNPTEFAVKVGVSYGAVISWEAGTRHPRWEKMIRLNELAAEAGVNLTAAAAS